MSSQSSSDALSRIRRGRRPSSVEPRLDPLAPNSPIQLVELLKITDRSSDTRAVNLSHVEQLIESIKVVGLITPLTLDRDLTLLAGAHRLAALKQLAKESNSLFNQLFPEGKVPARVMNISAQVDQLMALRVEIEENEKRRDYTANEVLEVAQTLEKAGFTRSRGRPTAGEKPLIPALESIFGKSKATIKRYLSQDEKEQNSSSLHDIIDPSEHIWQLAQESCDTLANKLKNMERELKRAHGQWQAHEEMNDDLVKQQRLISALEVSLLHLSKAKNALKITLNDQT